MKKIVKRSTSRKADRIVKRVASPSSRVVAEIVPAEPRIEAPAAVIEEQAAAAPVAPRKDRVAECFASAGLVDSEIARIRGAVPVLPIDVELIGRARAFVTANPSGWNHESWNAFLAELESVGYGVGPDRAAYFAAQRIVGVILESIRATEYRVLSEETLAKAA